MGQTLAIAGAAYLTPAEHEVALAVLQTEHERQLDAMTWAEVERFALAPCPVLPCPTQDEFRGIIKALAGTLKAPRTSGEQGQLQLSMFWAALKDVELFRIQGAAAYFINTAEWMPKALAIGHPVWSAHERAARFVRDREHRLHGELMRRLEDRTLGPGELDALTEFQRRDAVTRGLVVPTPEGTVVYRTREALERWEEHNRQLTLDSRKDQ